MMIVVLIQLRPRVSVLILIQWILQSNQKFFFYSSELWFENIEINKPKIGNTSDADSEHKKVQWKTLLKNLHILLERRIQPLCLDWLWLEVKNVVILFKAFRLKTDYDDAFYQAQFSMSFYLTTFTCGNFQAATMSWEIKPIRPADDKKLDQFGIFESLRTWKY